MSPAAPTTPEITQTAIRDRTSTGFEETGTESTQLSTSTDAYGDTTVALGEFSEPPVSSAVLQNMGGNEVGRRVLDAYQLAILAQSLPIRNPQHWEVREASLGQVDRVLRVLRQRLASRDESCSDQTIQAVLVLFVYASRFQTPDEATSHRIALERMISLRGGSRSFGHNRALSQQLERFASGEGVRDILQIPSEPEPNS